MKQAQTLGEHLRPVGTRPSSAPTSMHRYDWYDAPLVEPTDADIKDAVVDRLNTNRLTRDFDIKVDVKQRVVILGGVVDSTLTKRAAGDDAWDTSGVVDVSNQLKVAPAEA